MPTQKAMNFQFSLGKAEQALDEKVTKALTNL